MPDAIVLDGIHKRYGETTALDGLDLVVPQASVTALLGPNGAGKTTAVRIIATLLRPDSGSARVFGTDVVGDARKVRSTLGLTGQFSAVDEILTGAENLRMIGRLFRLSAAEARARTDGLITAFDLTDAANRQVKTYSGGMRRRLDLAASLMARPRMLVLDEPTTGLDPRSRIAVWEVVDRLRETGTTVLLTTQYLDEADRLADAVAVIDHGRLLAGGTPAELKAQVGGEFIEVGLADRTELTAAAELLARYGTAEPVLDHKKATVTVGITGPVLDGLPELLLELRRRSVRVADIAVRRPRLDEVFLQLTGGPGEPEKAQAPEPAHEEPAPSAVGATAEARKG